MPNLIEVQRESYEQFLRSRPEDGYVSGLEKTLRSVFPIRDFAGPAELAFVTYELEPPKYDVDECRHRGITLPPPRRVPQTGNATRREWVWPGGVVSGIAGRRKKQNRHT